MSIVRYFLPIGDQKEVLWPERSPWEDRIWYTHCTTCLFDIRGFTSWDGWDDSRFGSRLQGQDETWQNCGDCYVRGYCPVAPKFPLSESIRGSWNLDTSAASTTLWHWMSHFIPPSLDFFICCSHSNSYSCLHLCGPTRSHQTIIRAPPASPCPISLYYIIFFLHTNLEAILKKKPSFIEHLLSARYLFSSLSY